MRQKIKYPLNATIFFILMSVVCNAQIKFDVTDLRCHNMHNPEGVDSPLLSWKTICKSEGFEQSAYEIEMSSTKELLKNGKADIWNSGKQTSSEQINIVPPISRLSEGTHYCWRVRVWNGEDNVSAWSSPAYFSIGLLSEQSWEAKWITRTWENGYTLPYFRKVVDLKTINGAKPTRAIVYLCGLGSSDLFINGQAVDPQRMLDPAQTNYEQYALYSTFDVTQFIQEGENCIGIMLGKGWYTQDATWDPAFSYGMPMLRCQLNITYSDGSMLVFGSDESWTWKNGPVVKCNTHKGELYDASKEIDDWATVSLKDNGWNKAIAATQNVPPVLRPQMIDPIRKKEILRTTKMWQDTAGRWIFDFGENIAGVVQLELKQPAGTHLVIQTAEEISANGNLDFTSTGERFVGIQTDEYICSGKGMEKWSPRFTYHGFRYAVLSGMASTPELNWLSAIKVRTDVTVTGTFECSDEQINHLHRLAVHSVLSNFHGIPTDCPQREKCAWMGDVHAYVKMANLNFDVNNFWTKYMEDVCSTANKEVKNDLYHGRDDAEYYFADKPSDIPYQIGVGRRLCGVATPDWGTAMVQLPWYQYLYFGNKVALSQFYDNMKTWTDYWGASAKKSARVLMRSYVKTQWSDTIEMAPQDHIILNGLGDWCAPLGASSFDTPVPFTSTSFHYLDVSIMEQVAAVLGKTEDSKHFAEERAQIAKALISKFYNPDLKTFNSQTANSMALDLGFAPKEDAQAVSNAIVKDISERHDDFMYVGIFGIGRIGEALSRYGNGQTAFDVFTKKGENSFEWMWNKANATSLWEILPISDKSCEIAAPSSLNHAMQAGYGVWFYEDIAGIRPDISAPGFKVIRFEPTMTEYFSWAKASIQTPYGKVTSSWEKKGGTFIWSIEIPANSSGLVLLPNGKNIKVNGKAFDKLKYANKGFARKKSLYAFPSGKFEIVVD